MSEDPLSFIEERRAQLDIGVFALRIFRGAIEEGASRTEAVLVLCAWFKAMLSNNDDE